jgi:hypothetical protein
VTLLTCALLASCAASKPDRFHTLLASDPPAPVSTPNAHTIAIDVLPVSVPAYADQPQWVLRAADDSLIVLEQERWAAPLREELRSALIEQLVARWGAADARTLARAAETTWQVRVDVQRFEAIPGREARIDSLWSLASSARAVVVLSCRSSIRESAPDGGVPGLAAAHRRAVARLADEIGPRLQALQRGEPAACASTP